MALRIRLRRMGRRNAPTYRIVVAESSMPRDGRIVDSLGHYNPRSEPVTIVVDRTKALHWLGNGATPTETARALMKRAGVFRPEETLVETAAAAVSEAAKKTANAAKSAASSAATKVKEVAEEVGDAAADAVEAVTEAIEEAVAGEAAPAEATAAESPAAEATAAAGGEEAAAETTDEASKAE